MFCILQTEHLNYSSSRCLVASDSGTSTLVTLSTDEGRQLSLVDGIAPQLAVHQQRLTPIRIFSQPSHNTA
jgi:hypothetical protein